MSEAYEITEQDLIKALANRGFGIKQIARFRAKARAEAKVEALTEAAQYFDKRATTLTETVVDLPSRRETTEADTHRYGAYAAEAQNAALILARMAHEQDAS